MLRRIEQVPTSTVAKTPALASRFYNGDGIMRQSNLHSNNIMQELIDLVSSTGTVLHNLEQACHCNVYEVP
jgi:hypothetical protein